MAIVGYWRLNGNSNDASGNGYNCTDVSMSYTQNLFNGCAKFLHTVNRYAYTSVGILPNTATKLTISAIVYYSTTPYGAYPRYTIVSNRQASGWSNDYALFIDSGDVVQLRLNTTSCVRLSTGTVPYNKISFVSITYSSNSIMKIVINDKIESLANYTYTLGYAYPTYIGINPGGGSFYESFEDYIDEVKIYNSVMSDAQLKNEYSRVKGILL